MSVRWPAVLVQLKSDILLHIGKKVREGKVLGGTNNGFLLTRTLAGRKTKEEKLHEHLLEGWGQCFESLLPWPLAGSMRPTAFATGPTQTRGPQGTDPLQGVRATRCSCALPGGTQYVYNRSDPCPRFRTCSTCPEELELFPASPCHSS